MAIAQREPSTRKTWPAKRPSAGPIAHNQIYRRIGEEAALLRGLFFKPELYADSISALSFRYLTAPVPRDATGLLMRALFVGRLKARLAAVGADAAADWSVGFCRSTIYGACSQSLSRSELLATDGRGSNNSKRVRRTGGQRIRMQALRGRLNN
jgi:hypothetical protein